MSSQRLFKRQSGQIQAVREDMQELLEATKTIVTKVKSSTPPAPMKGVAPQTRVPPLSPIPREDEEEPKDSDKSG